VVAQVENEIGLKFKCLKSNNEGEYYGSRFDEFYANQGIKRVKTISKNHHQNGMGECKSMTILERARSMWIHAGLPKQFWADAVNMTVYHINRGPFIELWDFGGSIDSEKVKPGSGKM